MRILYVTLRNSVSGQYGGKALAEWKNEGEDEGVHEQEPLTLRTLI